MLKNAPILILDEATAFADPDNEAKVQAAFAQLAKGKTVLMIAHRLSTVANADCIYFNAGAACHSSKVVRRSLISPTVRQAICGKASPPRRGSASGCTLPPRGCMWHG